MLVREQIEGKAGQGPTTAWRNGLNILCCVVVLVPPVLAVAEIHRYGINIPYQDDWGILKAVLESYAGTLSFNSLWAQHNEHRLLIVKIITVLLARATRYNLVTNLYCGLSFEFLALILIWRTLAITLRRSDSILVRPLLACASLLLFSAVSWENWTVAIASIQFFGGAFWATASVWSLAEWPGRWFGVLVASAAALLGMCTSALGFSLSIVVLLGVLAQERERRKIRWSRVVFLPAWSLAFLSLYFKGYDSMGHSVGSLFGRGGLHAIAYFFAYLGSPFTCGFVGLELTSAIGFAGVAWFSICLWLILRRSSELIRSAAPWILLGLFAILNAALTSFARLEFPLPQATSSRYRSIAVLLWLPLLVISSLLTRRIRLPRLCRPFSLASAMIVLVSISLYVVCYGRGLAHMRTHHAMMQQTLPSLLNYRNATDEELGYLFPDPSLIRAESELLKKYRLGPFAGILGDGTN